MLPIMGQFHAERPQGAAKRIAGGDLGRRACNDELTLTIRLIQPPPWSMMTMPS